MNLEQVSQLTESGARAYMESLRWPDGPICPHCGCTDVIVLGGKSTRAGLKKCRACKGQFTVTVGTIFEKSHVSLRKWLIALALMVQSKKGISALQVQRTLGLGSYQTAWFLCHRVREAMKSGPLADLLSGRVEADETYVGGKKRKGSPYRHRLENKTPVIALVERDGRVKTRVVRVVNGENLKSFIRESVDPDSTILSDEHAGYKGIGKEFKGGHHSVKHSRREYSRDGWIHCNTAESYFALLKRGIVGAFHSVSPEHLHRYADEFSFRWDTRKMSDSERFETLLKACPGKRLQYKP